MDSLRTASETIATALSELERSRSWLARNTQIPLTTLDRKLRGSGDDLTIAQVHAIAQALGISPVDIVAPTVARDSSAA